jgi:hypothetical protein
MIIATSAAETRDKEGHKSKERRAYLQPLKDDQQMHS